MEKPRQNVSARVDSEVYEIINFFISKYPNLKMAGLVNMALKCFFAQWAGSLNEMKEAVDRYMSGYFDDEFTNAKNRLWDDSKKNVS